MGNASTKKSKSVKAVPVKAVLNDEDKQVIANWTQWALDNRGRGIDGSMPTKLATGPDCLLEEAFQVVLGHVSVLIRAMVDVGTERKLEEDKRTLKTECCEQRFGAIWYDHCKKFVYKPCIDENLKWTEMYTIAIELCYSFIRKRDKSVRPELCEQLFACFVASCRFRNAHQCYFGSAFESVKRIRSGRSLSV